MDYEEKIKCFKIKKYNLQNSQEIRERDINYFIQLIKNFLRFQ